MEFHSLRMMLQKHIVTIFAERDRMLTRPHVLCQWMLTNNLLLLSAPLQVVDSARVKGTRSRCRMIRLVAQAFKRWAAPANMAAAPWPPAWWTATPDAVRDRMEGGLWGAWMGDAAGAVLEFLPHVPTEVEVARALSFPGGGVWNVAPGQITDDGELTLCLWAAVRDAPDGATPETLADRASQLYRRWYASNPFDIGAATTNAVSASGDNAAAMRAHAAQHNQGSQSNGALMRCTPLAVVAARFGWPDEVAAAAARADASLTHPDATVQAAVAAYVVPAAELIRSGDAAAAQARAEAWITRDAGAAAPTLRAWLEEAKSDAPVAATDKQGWIKHAWVLAFRALHRGLGWEDAVRQTLLLGGDTDTNACIVGGLVGARVGASGLPEASLARVRTVPAEPPRAAPRRPLWLHPSTWLSPEAIPFEE